MKKLLFCIIALTATPFSAAMLNITVVYSNSLNQFKGISLSIDSKETIPNILTKIHNDISQKEGYYIINSCLDGMGENLSNASIQAYALNKIFSNTKPTIWINC